MSFFGTPEERTRRVGGWAYPLFVAGLLLAFLVALPLLSPASGATLSQQLKQKQAELNSAYAEYSKLQDKLGALADKYNSAEVRLAEIDDAILVTEKRITISEKDLASVQGQLETRLVSLYKDGFSSAPRYLEILFAESDFASVLSRFSQLSRIADQDQELFGQVESYLEKTREDEATLEEKKQDQASELADIQALQSEISGEFQASSAEYKRLKSQVLTLREEVRKAEEAEKLRQGNTSQSNSHGGKVQPGSFVFPVDGPHSFTDSWGAPRSGGRTHTGTDILAAKGTPLVACVSGTISRTNTTDSGLGGITVWLRGNNGTSYYYAHMSGIASGIHSGVSVSAGQLLGWVGCTGNANGCYHLHFAMYPGGGGAANPYATLRAPD